MRIQELYEARQGSLFHSMDIKYAADTLARDRVLGTAIQRYHDQGKTLLDPDFQYHDWRKHEEILADPNVSDTEKKQRQSWSEANWYLGISLSRTKNFEWKDVVLELDQALLAQRYKIIPWDWAGSGKNRRREKEEFLVLQKNAKDHVNSGKTSENNPKLAPLSKYLTGVYLRARTVEVWGIDDPQFAPIVSHPL